VDCGLRIGVTEKTSDVPPQIVPNPSPNKIRNHCFGLHFVMLGGLRYNHFDLLEMTDWAPSSKRLAILTSCIASAMSSMRFLTPKRCGVNWLNWPKEKTNTEPQSAFARLLKCDCSYFHIIISTYPQLSEFIIERKSL
jgi:hypothetical protein